MKHLNSILKFLTLITISACHPQASNEFSSLLSAQDKKSLFVASGACYAGGVTTSTGSATVAKFDTETGTLKKILVDYNRYSPGDMPIAVEEYDSENVLVLVENTSGRRVDLVKKDGSAVSMYLSNSTALNGATRSMVKLNDRSVLISKSTAVEKFSGAKARVLQGANPFINAPAGTCAASTTLISSLAVLPTGYILYGHAAATPNNKIAVINSTGYSVAGDCLGGLAGPATTALPSAVLYHSTGKILVGYGSTTAATNYIYAYDINLTTHAISGATSALYDNALVYGPSAMAEDTSNQKVYIANGASTHNIIYRYTFSATTKKLTLDVQQPFQTPSVYMRCVSGLKVMGDVE